MIRSGKADAPKVSSSVKGVIQLGQWRPHWLKDRGMLALVIAQMREPHFKPRVTELAVGASPPMPEQIADAQENEESVKLVRRSMKCWHKTLPTSRRELEAPRRWRTRRAHHKGQRHSSRRQPNWTNQRREEMQQESHSPE